MSLFCSRFILLNIRTNSRGSRFNDTQGPRTGGTKRPESGGIVTDVIYKLNYNKSIFVEKIFITNIIMDILNIY